MTKKRTRYLLYPAKDQSNKEVLEFPSEEARSNYARNMNRSLVIPSDFPENDSQQQYTFSAGVLPEVLVTPKTWSNTSQNDSVTTQQLITDLNSPTYQDYIDTRYQSRGPVKTKDNFTLSDWSRNIPKSYWSSDTHRNFKDGMTAASLFTAAPFAAEAAGEYVLPWMSENVFPYLTANGWLKSTQAVGNTPAWLTPTSATAIDAILAGSATGASINDMRENGPTVSNVLGTALGVGGLVYEAAPTIMEGYAAARNMAKPAIVGMKMRSIPLEKTQPTEFPLNVGWGPRQTVSVTHKSDQASPLSLYNEQRWDVLNEGANPLGIWFQGKFGIPRSVNTGATPTKAQKALRARQLFSRRPYTHSGDLTLDKPLVTIGDVPNRSALSYQAEQMGADGLIYNNVYDNGYDANQVLLSFRHPDNYMLTARAYKGGPEISNVPTIDIRQSLVNQYNTNKYIRLLGKAKDSDQFKGSIKDRSIVTRPFAEYLEKLGINSSLFTEKDLNTLIQMRSKLVQRTIPQTGRSAISYEMKPKNQQTVFSIDINENGTTLGEISARSHNPNHPRANEVPIDMVSRVEVSPSRGLSEDAYNAAIDYVKQTGIGEGLVSGERLLSPEITYNVWKHYPNRQLLRTNGHHTFGTGRDVVGQPVSETHKGPVVMLTEPSKTPLPMKSNSIFHPDMIKDGKLLPPDWTKYGIYYSLPLLLGTYGMFTNKKAN